MANQWEDTLQGKKLFGAYGTRDILIIAQDDDLCGPDIEQRLELEMTNADETQLQRLEIPPEQWHDDASIMTARCSKDKEYKLLPIERSTPGNLLTKQQVLSKIENCMKTTMKDGLTIHYIGPGKRKTGNWCFQDGFITFSEIVDLYLKHLKGKVLTIHSDCSYAGFWIKALVQFLDDKNVRPCGHSAKDKGILLKVFASCKTNEVAHKLAYSIRGAYTDKNLGTFSCGSSGKEVGKSQHVQILDATRIKCENKEIKAECALLPTNTWQEWSMQNRIFLVRGNDKGRPAWHYLLLVDDDDIIDQFKEQTQGTDAGKHTINCNNYGQVLKSGWGESPPNDVKEWMEKNYGAS